MFKLKLNTILLSFFAFFLVLIPTIVAVITYAEWQNGQSTIIINKGQSTTFDVGIYSANPPLDYSIKLYNSAGDLIYIYVDTRIRHIFAASTMQYKDDGWFSERIEIIPAHYVHGGSYSLIINAEDSIKDTHYNTLKLKVINHAPVVDIPDITLDENTFTSINLDNYFSDADNDDATWSFSGNTNIGVSIINNIATLTPTSDWNGQEIIRFTACDNDNACGSDDVKVIVNPLVSPLNHAPIITSVIAPTTIDEGQWLSVSFNAMDPDGDALTYTVLRDGVVIANTNSHNWLTNMDDAGTYIYTFIVSDGLLDDSETRGIVVNDSEDSEDNGDDGDEDEEGEEKLRYLLEITPLNNYIKIRNLGHNLKGLKVKVFVMDSNLVQTRTFDIDRNCVKYIYVNNLSLGSHLAKIRLSNDKFSMDKYLILNIE